MPAEALPPPIANVDAEAGLLGAMMVANNLVDQIADTVTAEDFFEPMHGRIFSAILKEHGLGRAANPVTLRPYFADDISMKDVGGHAYLAQLTGSGAAVVGARDMAAQVVELARRRTLLERLAEISTTAANWEKPFVDLVAEAEAAITDAGRAADDGTVEISLADAMADAFEGETAQDGIICGIEAIDKALGPIHPKEMVVIAGRPGMGKTVCGLSYALGAVKARLSLDFDEIKDAALVISLEMSARQLAQRATADLCFDGHRGINYGDIVDRKLTNEQSREVARAVLRMRDIPLEIVDASRMTVGRLGTTVRRWKRRFAARGHRLRLVVVDYLQLVQPDQREKDLYTRITEVSKGLKAVAKANDIALIALAQLSRDVEKRGGDKRPNLGDLRDSGQIEQDADGVMFLYRAEYYLKKEEPAPHDPKHAQWEEAFDKVRGQIEFIVAKRRERPESIGRGRFYGAFQAVR
jgi:replicative DNA helicase